jgi:hypothetical protein
MGSKARREEDGRRREDGQKMGGVDKGGGEGRDEIQSRCRSTRGRRLLDCLRRLRAVVSCSVFCHFEGECAGGVEVLDVWAVESFG